jgi:hypothetical protein
MPPSTITGCSIIGRTNARRCWKNSVRFQPVGACSAGCSIASTRLSTSASPTTWSGAYLQWAARQRTVWWLKTADRPSARGSDIDSARETTLPNRETTCAAMTTRAIETTQIMRGTLHHCCRVSEGTGFVSPPKRFLRAAKRAINPTTMSFLNARSPTKSTLKNPALAAVAPTIRPVMP